MLNLLHTASQMWNITFICLLSVYVFIFLQLNLLLFHLSFKLKEVLYV